MLGLLTRCAGNRRGVTALEYAMIAAAITLSALAGPFSDLADTVGSFFYSTAESVAAIATAMAG